MTISSNCTEIISDAKRSIRRNIACIKNRLRQASIEVKEQLLNSFTRSLLIYFSTPLVVAGIWSRNDIDLIEKEYYRETHLLPKDLKRDTIINVAMSGDPAWTIIQTIASKIRSQRKQQTMISDY